MKRALLILTVVLAPLWDVGGSRAWRDHAHYCALVHERRHAAADKGRAAVLGLGQASRCLLVLGTRYALGSGGYESEA